MLLTHGKLNTNGMYDYGKYGLFGTLFPYIKHQLLIHGISTGYSVYSVILINILKKSVFSMFLYAILTWS